MMRPRESHGLQLEKCSFKISPAFRIRWIRDLHENNLGLVDFTEPAAELEIDADKRTLALTLELIGESEPVQIRIKHYELIERDDQTYLELGEIETSRAWVNTLLREHLLEKVINPRLRQTPLPAMVRMVL